MRCFNCLGQHDTNCCPRNVNPNANRYGETIEKLGHISLQRIDNITIQSLHINKIHISDDYGDLILDELGEIKNYLAGQLYLTEKICKILPFPRTTEANELFFQGLECFKLDMFKESLYLLQQGIKLNPLDYRIHLLMSYLYVINNNTDNALYSLEYYCLKTAPTDLDKSYAYLLIARLKYCMGEVRNALEQTRLAIQNSPDYAEAYYQSATYETHNNTGINNNVGIYLEKAIDLDSSNFVRAKFDQNFDSIRNHINNFLKNKEKSTKTKAQQEFITAHSKITIMKEWYEKKDISKDNIALQKYISIRDKILNENKNIEGFLDYLRILQLIKSVKEDLKYIENSIEKDLITYKNSVKDMSEKIDENVSVINNTISAYLLGFILIVFGYILGNLGGLLTLIIFAVGGCIIFYKWNNINIGELKRYNRDAETNIYEYNKRIKLAEYIKNNIH